MLWLRGAPFTWVPHITSLLQNQGKVLEALSNLLSQLSLRGLTYDDKKIRLVNEEMGRAKKVENFNQLLRSKMNKANIDRS